MGLLTFEDKDKVIPSHDLQDRQDDITLVENKHDHDHRKKKCTKINCKTS